MLSPDVPHRHHTLLIDMKLNDQSLQRLIGVKAAFNNH